MLNDKQSVVIRDSFSLPARSQIQRTIKVKRNQILEVTPNAVNKMLLSVTRPYEALHSNTVIDGNFSRNINIIQLENLQKTSIEVAQLMAELNTNAIFQKLLDTTNVIIDKKIMIGSFLIYNETQKKFVEVFPPTTDWYDKKMLKY